MGRSAQQKMEKKKSNEPKNKVFSEKKQKEKEDPIIRS